METNNFLANAPMLYVNDDKSINIYEEDGNWWLKVDYSQFLVKIENETLNCILNWLEGIYHK